MVPPPEFVLPTSVCSCRSHQLGIWPRRGRCFAFSSLRASNNTLTAVSYIWATSKSKVNRSCKPWNMHVTINPYFHPPRLGFKWRHLGNSCAQMSSDILTCCFSLMWICPVGNMFFFWLFQHTMKVQYFFDTFQFLFCRVHPHVTSCLCVFSALFLLDGLDD